MSNLLVSFLFAIGASGWIYSKVQRHTGGNTKNALTVAAVSGLALMLIFWGILSMIFG